MIELLRHWAAFRLDRRGVTALEYAIIAGVLGTVIVTAFTGLGTALKTTMATIATDL